MDFGGHDSRCVARPPLRPPRSRAHPKPRVARTPHATSISFIHPCSHTLRSAPRRFWNNVVVAVHGQNCLGTAAFVAGHATELHNNSCIVYGTERVDDLFENCNTDLAPAKAPVHGYNNRFYTELGNASATCDCCGLRPLKDLPPGLEDNFQALLLPSGDDIIAWGREKLFGGL